MGYNPFDYVGTDKRKRVSSKAMDLAQGVVTEHKLREMIREEYYKLKEGNLTEVDFEKVKLPSTVGRFLNKFVDSVKSAGLNRIKRSAVLYKVINAMGMSPQQLMADIQKIKKGLKK